jgi:ABC-type amino acid transport substrate-binding protein
MRTITPGVLKVASAFPDPPFEVEPDGGFDAELMQALCERLALRREPVKYAGSDFNGIFDGLGKDYDAVISGTTITPERADRALFSGPYLEFDQGVAVNAARHPHIKSLDDLAGMEVGIQTGNTSDAVARRLLAAGKIAGIKYYPYSGIETALDDLASGRIGAVIKLLPVISWLIRERHGLAVVAEAPTHERLGIAFAKSNAALRDRVNSALVAFKATADFKALCAKWQLEVTP